jgi:hypothetical protein
LREQRTRRERRGSHDNEHAAPMVHSITLSARASTDCGIVRPSALAVRELIMGADVLKNPMR